MRHPLRPPIVDRRRARRLAVWNAVVWAVGNGLASTTLVIYLARELHAERLGLSIGLLVATPHLAGLLRLGAPELIERLGDRKRFCIAAFFLGAVVLLVLPLVCTPGRLPSPGWSIGAMVLLWCLYHLLQYLGMVGLWSWLADMASLRIRGRFFGWRNRWLVAGEATSAVATGLSVWCVREHHPTVPAWIPYAVAAGLGAAVMIASLLPLVRMPSFEQDAKETNRRDLKNLENPLKNLVAPFCDRRFLPLLLFGCWFSFSNGITQSAQNYYPINVLQISLFLSLSLQTGMRLGQLGASPWLGGLVDRWGNRPVMIVSQLLVAAGLLFFAAAGPEQWFWILGAWAFWIAYAGLNIGLPNLILKLSPQRNNASYLAAFYAVSGLCYAISTILGGALVDQYREWQLPITGVGSLSFFPVLFFVGWLIRSLGGVLLLPVVETAAAERDPR